MTHRPPSYRTLRRAFPEEARELHRILRMTRAELEATEAGNARVRECYNPPSTSDLRLTVMNAAAHTCGVESAQATDKRWLTYLNTGDTYAPTLCYWDGRYLVNSWGDLVEWLEDTKRATFK